ncbi:hypothetical protein [Hymenobacter persicinus]|uniref:Uncharacterized protein n=1 Tax=Hymenobacter persicinus TaxID=2025506 RepID=A0A4Q5LF94_9BACT|nr:hypothetical protein [Hymenobacter persicinus]RYU83705.1 hypothetical protein EWM57_01805 [Hymenobacter persicinus]
MENKPNQPTSGSSSQSTGAGKTNPSGASSQAGSTSSQNPSDRNRTSAAASANAAGAGSATNTNTSTSPASSTTDSSSPTSGQTGRQNQDQSQSRSQQGLQSNDQNQDRTKQSGQQSWMNVSSWLDGTNQLPQSVKDLGTKATDQFNKLSNTQKIVGGALLVSGLSWLALRSKSQPQPKSRKTDYRSSTTYRSGGADYNTDYGQSRPAYGSGTTADQKFQGPYGNSPSRGISDDYPTKSTSGSSDSGYRSGSTRPDSASTSGFGEDDYSSDL